MHNTTTPELYLVFRDDIPRTSTWVARRPRQMDAQPHVFPSTYTSHLGIPISYGKHVEISQRGTNTWLRAFQSTTPHDTAPAVCVHATAAALAHLAQRVAPGQPVRGRVEISSGGACEIAAVVRRRENGVTRVDQLWMLPRIAPSLCAAPSFGPTGHAIIQFPLLNNYFLALVPSVSHALAGEIWGSLPNNGPAAERRLVLIGMGKVIPEILFWGPRGAHPSAPLSGLMTVGLLAEADMRFAAALPLRLVKGSLGVEAIPGLRLLTDGRVAFVLPPVDVVRLSQEHAA